MNKSFKEIKKNLKRDISGLKTLNVALIGDSATQLLAQAIRGYGYEVGLHIDLYEADYDQIDMQILNAASELYQRKNDFIIIFQSTPKLMKKFYDSEPSHRPAFAQRQLEHLQTLHGMIRQNMPVAKVICFNFPETDDGVFGSFANKTDSSFLFQNRMLNSGLMRYAQAQTGFFVNDISALQATYGQSFLLDTRNFINADMVFSLDALPVVAKRTLDIILAVTGVFKKALILDLDNTLWGGVVGDDGLENIQIGDLGIGKAFTQLQYFARELKRRGVVLAVCSKNTEHIAKEPFERHPDMVLRLNDIAVFVANWDSKVDNIRYIQSILNIGFDSMVFLDDNPVERNAVRVHLPQVAVPELPEDPADYVIFLRTLNLFETASFTEEDALRTSQYQEEAGRALAFKSFTDENELLKSLEMIVHVTPFNDYNIPRVAQLSQRSNQFNLRTVRYTEDQIRGIAHSREHFHLAFRLKDKFGDYGLICVVILVIKDHGTLFIDTWFMSCRVLKRGMEQFVLNKIVGLAKEGGYKRLDGEYLPTPKNGIVMDHYKNLGFQREDGHWVLEVDAFENRINHITE